MAGRETSGVECTGQDGACTETFTITETNDIAGSTDVSDFDCGGRCS